MTIKKELRLVNFVSVYEHVDISLFSDKDIKGVVNFSPEDDQGYSFVDAPSLKALILPKRKRGIIFEGNKIRLDDVSGNEPKNTDIIDYFMKISSLPGLNDFLAYGFNYHFIVMSDKEIKSEEFLAEKIKSSIVGKIKGAGATLIFSLNEKQFTVEIKPSANPKNLPFNLNVHYNSDKIPEKEYLMKELEENYEFSQNLIDKIII